MRKGKFCEFMKYSSTRIFVIISHLIHDGATVFTKY